MRKLDGSLQSCIDSWIIEVTDRSNLMEVFHGLGLTPNLLTTIGNLCRIVSIYYLIRGQTNWFLFWAFVSYFFDCFDGHFARKYNQSTVFGDYYDHVSDWVYHLALAYLIYQSSKFQRLNQTSKFLVVLGMGIITYLFMVHTGCQELNFKCDETLGDCSQTLGPLKSLCYDKDWIYWSRYFGTGTYVLIFYLLTQWFY